MKQTLLIITALLFITSTVIPQSKANINNLVEYGGKMFKQDDDKPYTGSVFDLYKSTGEKKLEGRYRSGLKDGKWSFWNKNGQKQFEGAFKNWEWNGLLTRHNKNGKLWSEEKIYENGKLVSEKE